MADFCVSGVVYSPRNGAALPLDVTELEQLLAALRKNRVRTFESLDLKVAFDSAAYVEEERKVVLSPPSQPEDEE
jgi:hypothetical protein